MAAIQQYYSRDPGRLYEEGDTSEESSDTDYEIDIACILCPRYHKHYLHCNKFHQEKDQKYEESQERIRSLLEKIPLTRQTFVSEIVEEEKLPRDRARLIRNILQDAHQQVKGTPMTDNVCGVNEEDYRESRPKAGSSRTKYSLANEREPDNRIISQPSCCERCKSSNSNRGQRPILNPNCNAVKIMPAAEQFKERPCKTEARDSAEVSQRKRDKNYARERSKYETRVTNSARKRTPRRPMSSNNNSSSRRSSLRDSSRCKRISSKGSSMHKRSSSSHSSRRNSSSLNDSSRGKSSSSNDSSRRRHRSNSSKYRAKKKNRQKHKKHNKKHTKSDSSSTSSSSRSFFNKEKRKQKSKRKHLILAPPFISHSAFPPSNVYLTPPYPQTVASVQLPVLGSLPEPKIKNFIAPPQPNMAYVCALSAQPWEIRTPAVGVCYNTNPQHFLQPITVQYPNGCCTNLPVC